MNHFKCCCLTIVCCLPCYCLSAQNDTNVWTEFGHSRNWSTPLTVAQESSNLFVCWKQQVGEGFSQIVGNEKSIFVASGRRLGDANSNKIETELCCYAIETGERLWSYRFRSELYGNHQTFGGRQPCPQSTPLLVQGRIVFSTFTGDLICLDAANGKEVWKKSMRDEFAAGAVDFGTAASPVACPRDPGRFVVLAAGEKGGLIKFDVADGKVDWICPVSTFGYGTPVFANLRGQPQWITVSRNAVLAARARDGKRIWSYALKTKGLTNVPSPLIVDDNRLLISCQGTAGVECIEVLQDAGKWNAKQSWFDPRTQFFYTNWLGLADELVAACTSKYLTVFRASDGKRLGRWRGFGDGNILLRNKNSLIVLNGKGELSFLDFQPEQNCIKVKRKYEIAKGRFWVTPSVIGNRIFIRFDKELHCLSFVKTKESGVLTNQIKAGDETILKLESDAPQADSVQQVIDVFQEQGQEAAFELYQSLRADNKLSVEQRITLANSAKDQGLKEIAKQIMNDARADFPESKLLKNKR